METFGECSQNGVGPLLGMPKEIDEAHGLFARVVI